MLWVWFSVTRKLVRIERTMDATKKKESNKYRASLSEIITFTDKTKAECGPEPRASRKRPEYDCALMVPSNLVEENMGIVLASL